jgi:hypothetical protein
LGEWGRSGAIRQPHLGGEERILSILSRLLREELEWKNGSKGKEAVNK